MYIWGVYLRLKLVIFQASHLGFQEESLRNTQENKQKSKHKHTEKQNTMRFVLAPKTLPIIIAPPPAAAAAQTHNFRNGTCRNSPTIAAFTLFTTWHSTRFLATRRRAQF